MPEWTPDERLQQYERALIERLGVTDETLDEAGPDGPLITLLDAATLGGVSRFAVEQAHARTKRGEGISRWPAADEKTRATYRRLVFPAFGVLDYFVSVGNWPLGVASRLTLGELYAMAGELALQVREARIDDGRSRSVQQWRQYLDRYRMMSETGQIRARYRAQERRKLTAA